jgi:hypothetical protein
MFQKLRMRRAARKYARRLGTRLASSYGSSEFYTPQQIEHAAQRCHLPMKYLKIGQAACLPHDTYFDINPDSAPAEYTLFSAAGEAASPNPNVMQI